MAYAIAGWSGIAIHKDLSENDRIYHYYTMKNFIRLYKSRKLHLTHIYNWDDPWELPYKFINVNNVNKSKDTSAVSPFEDYGYINFIATYANSMLKNDSIPWIGEAGAISFTKNNDCDFMWKSFANGYGVCVETKIIDLIESIKYNPMRSLFVAPIQYIDVEEEPKKIFLSKERKYYPYTIWMGYVKRNNFKHENEIRVIIQPRINSKEMTDVNVDLNRYINRIVLYPNICDKECDCQWDIHEKQRVDAFRKDFPKLNCDVDISQIYRCKNIDINDFTTNDIKKNIETQSNYPKDCKWIYHINIDTGEKFNVNGNKLD